MVKKLLETGDRIVVPAETDPHDADLVRWLRKIHKDQRRKVDARLLHKGGNGATIIATWAAFDEKEEFDIQEILWSLHNDAKGNEGPSKYVLWAYVGTESSKHVDQFKYQIDGESLGGDGFTQGRQFGKDDLLSQAYGLIDNLGTKFIDQGGKAIESMSKITEGLSKLAEGSLAREASLYAAFDELRKADIETRKAAAEIEEQGKRTEAMLEWGKLLAPAIASKLGGQPAVKLEALGALLESFDAETMATVMGAMKTPAQSAAMSALLDQFQEYQKAKVAKAAKEESEKNGVKS